MAGAMGSDTQPIPRYELECIGWHVTKDDDTYFKVRRNGKALYIHVKPSEFVNSPKTKALWLSYLKNLRGNMDAPHEEYVDDYEINDWAIKPFEPFIEKLAPSPPPGTKVTLEQYFRPESFYLVLDVMNEEKRPRHVEMERLPYGATPAFLPNEVFEDVGAWTTIYDPAEIWLSSEDPEDDLFIPSKRVRLQGSTIFHFFKSAEDFSVEEFAKYKKMASADLDPNLRLRRPVGVVRGEVFGEEMSPAGLLMTYIPGATLLDLRLRRGAAPDSALKQRWMEQIETTVAALHKAGIVWGDVQHGDIFIDRDDNAWVAFGLTWIPGEWVDRELVGTVEGDLVGMAKLKEYIFQRHTSRSHKL